MDRQLAQTNHWHWSTETTVQTGTQLTNLGLRGRCTVRRQTFSGAMIK